MSGDLAAFDPRTGEIFGLVGRSKRPPTMYRAWHIVDDAEYERALVALRREERGVFAALPLYMARGNWLMVKPADLGRKLGLSQATVYRALARMDQIWAIGEVAGGRQFSPQIAWKGAAREHPIAVRAWQAALGEKIRRAKKSLQTGLE